MSIKLSFLRVVLVTISIFLVFIVSVIIVDYNIKKNQAEVFEDPCQTVHKLNTISVRERKPQYSRRLKQVILTCGEKL